MIACIIFAVVILPTQYKNSIKSTEKGHILKKFIAVFVFIVLLSAVAYFSGAKNFQTAFLHVFILFFAVNLFDVIVLDIGVFCHSKKLRITGTEDMDREYKNYLFHVKGALKGIVLGIVISLLSASIVHIVSMI